MRHSWDDRDPAREGPELRGSHESLAASSPSHSHNPGAMAPQQGRAEGVADPDAVNLDVPPGAWGEESDILSYVQNKVSLLQTLLSNLGQSVKTLQQKWSQTVHQ